MNGNYKLVFILVMIYHNLLNFHVRLILYFDTIVEKLKILNLLIS